MSDVPEAAASLFGSEEESADPFAVIGTTSTQGNTEATNLFPNDDQSSFLDSLAQDPGTTSYNVSAATYEPPATTDSRSDVAKEVPQYQPVESTGSVASYGEASYGTAYAAGNTSAYNPSRYQPAAPAQTTTVQPSSQTYSPGQYAPAAGATPSNPYPYDYSRSTSTTNPYSQYAPSNSYVTPPAPPAVTTPAPPPPKAPLNRPKVVNAYDPPFPTTTSRRTTRQASSTYGSYGAYQPAQPFPPPSPFYASTGFAAQQSQTPPPLPPASQYVQYAQPPQQRAPPAKSTTLPYGQGYGVPPAPSGIPEYGVPPRAHSRGSSYGQHKPPTTSAANGAIMSVTPSPSQFPPPPQSVPSPPRSNAPARSSTLDSVGSSHQTQSASQAPAMNGYNHEAPVSDTVATNISVPRSTKTQAVSEEFAGEDFFNGDYDNPEEGPQVTEDPASEAPQANASHTDVGRVESPAPVPDHSQSSNDLSYPVADRDSESLSAYPDPEEQGPSLLPLDNDVTNGHPAPISSPPPNQYLPSAIPSSSPPSRHAYAPTAQPTSSSIPPAQTVSPPPANPYAPSVSKVAAPPTVNPYSAALPVSKVASPPPANPYAPTAPPNNQAPFNPYAPPAHSSVPPTTNPYAPPAEQSAKQATKSYDPYAPSRSNTLGVPVAPGLESPEMHTQTLTYVPSTFKPHLGSPAVFSNAYAPSPSLVGANDPLSRVSGRAPVFSFGFGGRLVTCFHGGGTLNTGFDVALSSRNTTSVKIHTLNKLLPQSALSDSEAEFPGPLFADPSTQSLVRSAASAQAKKAKVVQYLDTRASELNQGLGYLSPADRKTTEAKLVLVRLLKVMVENDGKLSGSVSIDSAVRSALVPGLSMESAEGTTGNFTVIADAQSDAGSIYSGGVSTAGFEQPISVTTLRPSALNKIEELLMRGARKEAYVYALDQKLWAHAMVIASSIDKEAWKEVVNEFIQSELGGHDDPPNSASHPGSGDSNNQGSAPGRDSLRAAYRFFSGQGPTAVQELLPKQRPGALLLAVQGTPGITPRTPGFPSATFNSPAPESLSKWRETIAMMISSPPSPETPMSLTALGDQLLTYNWLEAAHVCYLLSPQTSPLGASGAPAARITLVGSKPPHLWPLFARNPDNFIFSEILEYALSLVPAAKGQEAFSGIAHLQPYRLLHATSLAELGYIQEANRYCEAITASIAKPSPFLTPTFVAQLRLLVDRISGVSHSEKSNSWIGGKITKPSLDSIGGWLEGRFTKLVTGDGEDEPEKKSGDAEQRPFDGPFAHYSTISNTPSARSSPAPRQPNVNPYAPPQRTSSAMAVSSPYQPYAPVDRASSAMDYIKHSQGRSSPVPPVPAYPSHLNMASVNTSMPKAASSVPSHTKVPSSSPLESPSQETPVQTQQGSSWWDYSSGNGASTPTATSFVKVDEPIVDASGEGFISLMDAQPIGFAAPAPPVSASRRVEEGDDMEDLGFGNSKKNEVANGGEREENEEETKSEAARPAPKPVQKAQEQQKAAGGSWISRWLRGGSKDGSTPGPIKASLGEENSFYYDKELKRWVNKKAGGDPQPAATTPPPPSRAQTASPSKSAMRPSPLGNGAAPPPRASSAMAMSSEVVLPPPVGRVRSNLVPTPEGGATPPPPMGGSRPPSTVPPSPAFPPGPPGSGPPSRPASQAARKKNLRSRYVDVFQSEGGAQ